MKKFVVAGTAAVLLAALALGSMSLAQESVEVTMESVTGSEGPFQIGAATLTAVDGQTQVVINIEPSPEGADVEQPVHIHDGSCSELGTVVYPLSNVVDGSSTTTVDATLESLRTGDFAVNVHKSPDEAAVYVSCGDVPVASIAQPVPEDAQAVPEDITPPSTGISGFSQEQSSFSFMVGLAATMAMFGIASIGFGYAMVRIRR